MLSLCLGFQVIFNIIFRHGHVIQGSHKSDHAHPNLHTECLKQI